MLNVKSPEIRINIDEIVEIPQANGISPINRVGLWLSECVVQPIDADVCGYKFVLLWLLNFQHIIKYVHVYIRMLGAYFLHFIPCHANVFAIVAFSI